MKEKKDIKLSKLRVLVCIMIRVKDGKRDRVRVRDRFR